jgi:hypothetical protein
VARGEPSPPPEAARPKDTGPKDTGPKDTGPKDTGPKDAQALKYMSNSTGLGVISQR